MPELENTPIDPSTTTANTVSGCLTGRRTISRFSEKPVDPALLLDAIEAARWAPNHYLTEPWFFYVLGEQSVPPETSSPLTHNRTSPLIARM